MTDSELAIRATMSEVVDRGIRAVIVEELGRAPPGEMMNHYRNTASAAIAAMLPDAITDEMVAAALETLGALGYDDLTPTHMRAALTAALVTRLTARERD